MNIAIAQQNYHIGNFESNTAKIISAIKEAKQQGAELVVFSELCVCGYPPRDFLEFNDFIDKCYQAVDTIKQYADTIGVLIGAPARNPVKEGKNLFNAAFLLYEGDIKGVVHKTLLPTYDVFDEYRYFEPAYEWNVLEFKGRRLAVTICEDIWNIDDDPLYRFCPMDKLISQQPDIMINLSASPFDYIHEEERLSAIKSNVLKYGLPMVYCNAVGSQTEIVFDGGSIVMDAAGNLVKRLPSFEECVEVVDLEGILPSKLAQASRPVPMASLSLQKQEIQNQVTEGHRPGGLRQEADGAFSSTKNIEKIHQALLLGIKDYFSKMGFTKAILGSSGGIDSAVTLALACEALGKENVRAILMPSPYSTEHSVNDAVQLSKNLGNPYDIIQINDIYDSFLKTLKPIFNDLPFSLAEENVQSRTRGNLLMAIANKFGYILLNTSNKSELATGYGTLYGDMAGGIGVLGDCYKMQVYALAAYINRDQEIIPANIIHKAPSAELRPDQKDADSLPEYNLLDKILYQYIERRQGPAEIKAQGFDTALVARVLKLVNTNEYKRNQFCPIIRVSPKAFGVGRRVPIVGKYLS